jgi:hypothetical protein
MRTTHALISTLLAAGMVAVPTAAWAQGDVPEAPAEGTETAQVDETVAEPATDEPAPVAEPEPMAEGDADASVDTMGGVDAAATGTGAVAEPAAQEEE